MNNTTSTCFLVLASLPFAIYGEQSQPSYLPDVRWHLTARPWQPVNASERELLDQLDAAVHALAPLQYWNAGDPKDVRNGAILDPYNKGAEVQYATPLFSFNVAVLLAHGRGADLVTQGVRALDRATLNISMGKANDSHGEFFGAPMIKAFHLYKSLQGKFSDILTDEKIATWKKRLATSRRVFMNFGPKQNWRTFAMKGEWLRQKAGFISDGVEWNEANWLVKAEGEQRERFRRDLDSYKLSPHFFLYHDDTADPETFAYNGATTANLLDMLENGYDGASASEMRAITEHSLTSALLLMGGSGEAPAGGRTGEHIWDYSVYALGFEMMAEISRRGGDVRRAGQFRRAAQLAWKSHARFRQERGWFAITKNLFHPSLKHRYASWSGLTNYNGYTLQCMAESILTRKSEISEQPTPAEIGGYAVTLDPEFANVFLNAGGMQMQLCTRGETDGYGKVQWHTLGIARFSRPDWDSRLGPGAGHTELDLSDAISFSPVFLEGSEWTRVCQQPKRFGGSFRAELVHPLLVRGVFTLAPLAGQSGPTFHMKITLTPDGALVDTTCEGAEQFGVIWPLLEFDGRNVLQKNVGSSIASTAYPRAGGNAQVLQAEAATSSGSVAIAADQQDHRGSGLARFSGNGGALEWRGVEGGDGGTSAIGFRYALGLDAKSTRSAKLVVNGAGQPHLRFLSTGAWNDWHQLYVPVALEAGATNTIRIEADGSDSVIIDELRVHPAAALRPEPDQQNFIALRGTHQLDATARSVRGGYGALRPVRVTDSSAGTVETFVYPRSAGDPGAEQVRATFTRNDEDFSSILGRVRGTLYVGRTSAGGEGKAIDLDGDGMDDVSFADRCAFILQLRSGRVTAVEADRQVEANIAGQRHSLAAFAPVILE